MPTSTEKFQKLLAAYEDEVQRKQHKMGRRVDPRDEVQPNWITGYCTFLRGQTVVWSPSFELIGTWRPSTGSWLWGFADPSVEWKLRTRMEEVRKQGASWGIDMLVHETLTLASEQQAWELATVATAVTRADAMYRLQEADEQRFLALFDGPPASRSSTSMRALRESQMNMPAVQIPPNPASPALRRLATPMPASSPGGWHGPGGSLPASSVSAPASSAPAPSSEREPTAATHAEIAQRLFDVVPYIHQQHIGTITLLARAVPPTGPIGSVAFDLKLTLRPSTGGPDVHLQPTAALHDALVSLWMRCRDRGAGYRFITARLENGPQGLVPHIVLEW
ncbi:MAG: hypothetical protein HYV09_26440 [Deltaproteobacteria bacterium]|nr:hypothetical protein [Deltaproteobacteria bacterium]